MDIVNSSIYQHEDFKINRIIMSKEQKQILEYLISSNKPKISFKEIMLKFQDSYENFKSKIFKLCEKGYCSIIFEDSEYFIYFNKDNYGNNSIRCFEELSKKEKRILKLISDYKISNTELTKLFYKTTKNTTKFENNRANIRNTALNLVLKGYITSIYYGNEIGYVYFAKKKIIEKIERKKPLRKPIEI